MSKSGVHFYSSNVSTTNIAALSVSYRFAPNRTAEKIQSFSMLPIGWHYGDGVAPSPRMIDAGVGWNSALGTLGFVTTDAFPGVGGEVMVTAYHGAHYVEILIETDLSVSLIYENNGRELHSLDCATPAEAYVALQQIAGAIWNTSGYSIPITSIVNSANLRAWHSGIQEMGHQSFNAPVLMQPEPQSVRMSGGIIQMSGGNLPFFGSSTKRSSRRIHA